MGLNPPRVAITGIGVVSPFGVGREVFWRAVREGRSGTRAIDRFDASDLSCQVAAHVPDDEVAAALEAVPLESHSDVRRAARVSQIAMIAAREAMADAGITNGEVKDLGALLGSGAGGIDVGERQYGDFYSGDRHRVSPYAIPVSTVGMVSSEVSIGLGLRGPSHVMSTGCTSSTDAIGYAANLIRHGEVDVIVSGGADACVTPGMIFGFTRMRVVSTAFNDRPAEASRPFDRDRDGFVLGEGAWMLTLERLDRAKARGARVYATVDGYASTCDAYHRVQMDPEGAEIVRALTLALSRAGAAVEEVGYVNYHGTSTRLNDAVEMRCVQRLLGARAGQVPGSSTKSMIGHPQGASGAAGVVATAMAIANGVLPPTINQAVQDPECELDVIPNVARCQEVDVALCNCLGFGSKNSALVLRRE